MLVYKILENPYVHNFVQKALLIGRKRAFRHTEQSIAEYCGGRVLDIGCGTGRYAHLFKDRYVGVDVNARYLDIKIGGGKQFVCCNAASLPFKERKFDSIFSIGFFHHIDFCDATRVFREIIRVSKPDTTVLIIDAFYPDNLLDVFGFVLMRWDRGRYARKKKLFIKELENYFDVLKEYPINGSYPYNVHAFVLRRK